MEPVRPKVDAFVLDLLSHRTFKRSEFFETREGICRLMPTLAHKLAETGPIWGKELGPVTERVAKKLFATSRKPGVDSSADLSRRKPLPTPLTESNRSEGRKLYKREPELKTVEEIRAWLFR